MPAKLPAKAIVLRILCCKIFIGEKERDGLHFRCNPSPCTDVLDTHDSSFGRSSFGVDVKLN